MSGFSYKKPRFHTQNNTFPQEIEEREGKTEPNALKNLKI